MAWFRIFSVCARRPRLGAQGYGQGKRSCAMPGSGRPLRAKTAAAIPARPCTHPVAHEPAGASRERRAHARHPPKGMGSEFFARVRDVPGTAHRDAGRGSGLAPCRGRGDLCARKRQPRSRHAPTHIRTRAKRVGRAGNVARTPPCPLILHLYRRHYHNLPPIRRRIGSSVPASYSAGQCE